MFRKFNLIYNDNVVPQRCKNKIKIVLGERAIGLKGGKTNSKRNTTTIKSK